jgi:hypothetical protein
MWGNSNKHKRLTEKLVRAGICTYFMLGVPISVAYVEVLGVSREIMLDPQLQ